MLSLAVCVWAVNKVKLWALTRSQGSVQVDGVTDGSSESGPLEMARLYLHEADTEMDTKNGYRLRVVGHVHVHI
jgi:hypothetical protein